MHSGESLHDGYAWDAGKGVKQRVSGDPGRFHKNGDIKVMVSQRQTLVDDQIIREPWLASRHGFTKCKCIGILRCMNDMCPYFVTHKVRSTTYTREGGMLLCKTSAGLGCRTGVTPVDPCGALKYRIGLQDDAGQPATVVVYHNNHTNACIAHCREASKDVAEARTLTDNNTITGRIESGINGLIHSVVARSGGQGVQALKLAADARKSLSLTAPAAMKSTSTSVDIRFKRLTIESIVQELTVGAGFVFVPYHQPRANLSSGPPATVTMQGCCRTEADTVIFANKAEYMYSQVQLILAGCDDPRVHSVMDQRLVQIMNMPMSFDVQHPNKVKGHFTVAYVVYSTDLRKILTVAMVMIPALDAQNGYHARNGDNTQGDGHIWRSHGHSYHGLQ
jgi:hypothetical protein